jgi:vacuolar-type H+-ATPase subunit I/STV1
MIVRMSKVEIVGAKELLRDALVLLRELGVFQIEPATVGFIEEGHEEDIRSLVLDEKTMGERLFLEDLRRKIEGLLSDLPKLPVRRSYLEPRSIIDTIAKTLERHAAVAKELFERQDALQKEHTELDRYAGNAGPRLYRTDHSGARHGRSPAAGPFAHHRLEVRPPDQER